MTLPERRCLSRDLACLLLLALAFRLGFLLAMPRVLDNADAIHYVETATAFRDALTRSGEGLTVDPKIPVLYPLLGALVSPVAPDTEWACRAVSFLASVLLVVPVYLIARGLHGTAAARIAGAIIGLWPWLADYGCRVSTEATAVLWWFLGAWLVLSAAQRGGPWRHGLAPLPFAALHFTRPEGTALLLAVPVVAAWLFRDRVPNRRWLAPFAAAIALALAISVIYNRAVADAVSANVRVGYIVDEFDVLRFGQTALATLHDVFPIMLGPVLFLFLGVGLFQPRAEQRDLRAEFFLLILCVVQWGTSLFVLSPAPRYLMAPLIALALWSARGMDLTAREAASAGRGRLVTSLPVLAIVVSMLLATATTLGAEHLGRRPRQPREYKAAGLWMRENLTPGLVFTRKPQVGFYAGMPSTGPDLEDTQDEALTRAREAGARYVVVDERYTAPTVPGLRGLLDPASAPPGLRHLRTFDLYPEARVVVYAVEGVPGTPIR